MEESAESAQFDHKPRKKREFLGWCVAFVRWVFILLFTVVLLGGLYFKAPWKILVLDAVLLALLTVVPKKKRKYGWLALAAAVLAITVWIFIPESDSGNWRPYSFDEELAILEAERAVPLEDNAAPLYEVLFDRWEQIEEDDPYPYEADKEDGTLGQPWTAEEFSEIAVWFGRHEDFFQDLLTATQKPACCFPAMATTPELSKTMERLTPVKRFALHLIRASYLDIGENRKGAWEKQIAVLNFGKHIYQQPLLIELLVSVSLESLAHQAMTEILVNTDMLFELTEGDYLVTTAPIRTGHFDHREKWRQILAYEKLFGKNFWGMYYEINPQEEIRFARPKTFFGVICSVSPDEELYKLQNSYWVGVSWRASRAIMWFSGMPKDPAIISEWIDEIYASLEEVLEKGNLDFEETGRKNIGSFELNCKYVARQMLQITLPAFKKINDEILPRLDRQKRGTEIICDLVLYKKQHRRYPNTLDELRSSETEKQIAQDRHRGFLYQKIKDNFLLYHIGQNGIDENGKRASRCCGSGPEDSRYDPKKTADDILIWPRGEKERRRMLGIEEPDGVKEDMMPMMMGQ